MSRLRVAGAFRESGSGAIVGMGILGGANSGIIALRMRRL